MGRANFRYVPLRQYRLCTVREAAEMKKVTVQTVRNWVLAGWLHVAVASAGKREVWLLDYYEIRRFRAPPKGRRTREAHAEAKKRKRHGAEATIRAATGLSRQIDDATLDPTLVALAQRVRQGDSTAHAPLRDRMIELRLRD